MSRNKVVKSVSFNIMNEKDKAYLELIQDMNFSGYVKILIEKDIRQRKVIKSKNRPCSLLKVMARSSLGVLGCLLNR
jgi:hypothetical protein